MAGGHATARMVLHGSGDRGRNQSVTGAHGAMGMTESDGGRAHGAEREPRSDIEDPESHNRAVTVIARDVVGDPEARGKAEATEEEGRA